MPFGGDSPEKENIRLKVNHALSGELLTEVQLHSKDTVEHLQHAALHKSGSSGTLRIISESAGQPLESGLIL
jgi:hypothetical protein